MNDDHSNHQGRVKVAEKAALPSVSRRMRKASREGASLPEEAFRGPFEVGGKARVQARKKAALPPVLRKASGSPDLLAYPNSPLRRTERRSLSARQAAEPLRKHRFESQSGVK